MLLLQIGEREEGARDLVHALEVFTTQLGPAHPWTVGLARRLGIDPRSDGASRRASGEVLTCTSSCWKHMGTPRSPSRLERSRVEPSIRVAVGQVIDEAFARRQAQRIFAAIFVGNEASRNVVRKLGSTLKGTLWRAVPRRGEWLDEWRLAITRPDWEAAQATR